jgi:hypothetical protein
LQCPPLPNKLVDEHYLFLKRFFTHKNAIEVNGAPLFVVYDRKMKSRCNAIINYFKRRAIADGFPSPGLHTVSVRDVKSFELYSPNKSPNMLSDDNEGTLFFQYPSIPQTKYATIPSACFTPNKTPPWSRPLYFSVLNTFDNTPRRNFLNATIYSRNFSRHGPISDFGFDLLQTMVFERCCQSPTTRSQGGEFVAINAWNEWGEGAVLEPTKQTGLAYLEALVDARKLANSLGCDWDMLRKYNAQYLSRAEHL